VPFLLGHHPADQLVVLGLHGPSRRVHVLLRRDLGPPPDPEAAARAAAHLRGEGCAAMLVVGYGPAPAVTPAVDTLRAAGRAEGVPVAEALRVTDGRYWSYLCGAADCCPAEGTPVRAGASPVAAAAVAHGLSAWPDRARVRAFVDDPHPVLRSRVGRAAPRAELRGRLLRARTRTAGDPYGPAFRAEGVRVVGAAADAAARGRLPDDPGHIAWLAVLLGCVRVRDEAWARIGARTAPAHIALWRHVLRCVGPAYAAAPGSLLAVAAWAVGDLALAEAALDRVERDAPGYSMAGLVRRAVRCGLSWEPFPRHRLAPVGPAADRAGAAPGYRPGHRPRRPRLEGMPEYIYSLRNVRKAHGDKVVLDNVSGQFLPGAKIGVVGPNGAGKSTLLKLMAGTEQPSNGEARLMPGFTVGLLSQEPRLDPDKTVLQNVEDGVAETKAMLDRFNEVAEKMATDYSDELLEEMGKLQEQLDHRNAWDLDSQLAQAMDALRCPPPDSDVSVLSGGEKRRVALCKLLLEQPDLLLLDEPTNHLDAESVQWLEQHLENYPGTIIAITHDRYFLDNVATWILELDRGKLYPYEGNYTTYLDTKASRLKVEGQKDAKRRKRLQDELEWVRSNAKARQTKSRARLQRYEEMAAEADKTRKLDFEEIQIPPGPRLGTSVVEVKNLSKGFDDRLLIENLSFQLPPNGIVGVIGPNGVGKTTLFKMIVGEEKPDSGSIAVGDTVKISYVDQYRGRIDDKKNVWEAISDGETFIRVGNVEIPSRAYVAAFGFKGSDQQKSAGVLSGGERNRVNLALTLKQGGNLLLLDEPTNDLDVDTLGSLENALLDFPGCAVITSHDRWFLDRVATHILAWEGGANWFWFEGNFASYEKNKIERLGAEAARPHAVTHRKLTRD
jgi:ATP-binding cassette ChvD family protein